MLVTGFGLPGQSLRRVRGGVTMALQCVECGQVAPKLNSDQKCDECAKQDELRKSYFEKLQFLNEGCAKLVPAT